MMPAAFMAGIWSACRNWEWIITSRLVLGRLWARMNWAAAASAQGWATFDMFSDSVFADIAKYSKLDDAERRVHDLQLRLDRFKTELADVTIETDMQVGVRGFDRFADYFFDNIFTDWAVMDRISNSQSQVSRTRSQIAGVLQGLETMTAQTAQERVRVQETLDRLVRESGFAPGGLNG